MPPGPAPVPDRPTAPSTAAPRDRRAAGSAQPRSGPPGRWIRHVGWPAPGSCARSAATWLTAARSAQPAPIGHPPRIACAAAGPLSDPSAASRRPGTAAPSEPTGPTARAPASPPPPPGPCTQLTTAARRRAPACSARSLSLTSCLVLPETCREVDGIFPCPWRLTEASAMRVVWLLAWLSPPRYRTVPIPSDLIFSGGRRWVRTTGFSLVRRSFTVAGRCLTSPEVPVNWTVRRQASPCVAWRLPPLAPHLAPRNLVSLANQPRFVGLQNSVR